MIPGSFRFRNRLSSYFLDYPPAQPVSLSLFPSSGDDAMYMEESSPPVLVRFRSEEPRAGDKSISRSLSFLSVARAKKFEGRAAGERRSSREQCFAASGFQTPDGDECKNPSVDGHESTGSRFGERIRVSGVFVATNRFGVRDHVYDHPGHLRGDLSGRGANASEDIKGPARGNYCFSIPANRNRERGGACTIGAAILTLSFSFFLSFPCSFFPPSFFLLPSPLSVS